MAAGAAFEVRRMSLADLGGVLEVERASFAKAWSAEQFQQELEHDWSTILVAVPTTSGPGGAGSVVGFLLFWLVHDEVHVLNVATAPQRRRQGVARRLLEEAERRGRAAEVALLTLEVRRSNLAALQLYRQLGYREVGVRPRYYADGDEDALVMIKELRERTS